MTTAKESGDIVSKAIAALAAVISFLRLLSARFVKDQGMSNAASLTYTTLLSLVPLMTVVLAVFAAFPVSQQAGQQLQDFVFDNFMPAAGEVVQAYLQQFSSNAARLTGAGFFFLIIVALMMMATIDHVLNDIWRVTRKRSLLSKFTVYWAILSLGPLLIGLSVVATSYLVSMPLFADSETTKSLRAQALEVMPILSSIVAFTLLYSVVPNRQVPLRHALAGGLLAAILFELAKHGFAVYLTHFPTWQAIYGALSVIPIFLVWIYLSWMITLLGAEFSCCLGLFRGGRQIKPRAAGQELLLAYRLLHLLWQAQKRGESLSIEAISRSFAEVAEERLELLLQQLRAAHLVLHTEESDWALARDLSRVTLRELYASGSYVLPSAESLAAVADTPQQALAQVLQRLDPDLNKAMAVTLEDLYQGAALPAAATHRPA